MDDFITYNPYFEPRIHQKLISYSLYLHLFEIIAITFLNTSSLRGHRQPLRIP